MKIVSVEAMPVRMARPRQSAVGTAGSPATMAEGGGDYRWSTTVPALYSERFETALVKVATDSGLTGWGEAQAPLAPEVACDIVRLLLSPVVAGAEFDGSVERIRQLWDSMYQTMRVRGQTGGFMLDAISGVDIALWDLAGQIQAKPVSAIIAPGVALRAIPAYFSGVPGRTAEECVANARAAVEAGYRVFKLFHDGEARGLFHRLDALAGAFEGKARFAVDALWRLDRVSAVEFGRELDRRDALWLEAPLAPEDAAAHGELARAIRTPLAVGESYRTRFEVAPFFEQRAMGILQPDLGRCGITEFLRLAQMARERAVRVIPHVSIAMGPQIAAAIHAAAACGCEMLECNPNVLSVANAWLEEPLRVAGAEYFVPRGPGLGIRMLSLIRGQA